ncbi:MAG: PilN domain-containing protein, partial [Firmicutes bacterium]|nr:PilN domain-containing protein [Bacillota bacterium]
LFLGLLTIYGLLVGLDRSCLIEIKQLETLIANKSGDQIVYANLANQKEVLEHRRLILESINKEKELPLQTMVEIHKVLPIDTRLSNYSFQEGHLLVSGTTRNKEEILQFKEKLEGVEVFKMINMVNTSRKEEISADNKQPAGEAEWEFTFDIQVLEV